MLPRGIAGIFVVCAVAGAIFFWPGPGPTTAGPASTATAVAPGNQHTCALTQAGGVKCWGRNQVGQLGNNTTSNSFHPTQVMGLTSGVSQVDSDYQHTCIVKATGDVWCWGDNVYGQVGNSTSGNYWLGPVPACASGSGFGCTGGTPLAGAVAVATGDRHTCALMNTGGVKCWGDDFYGQLGNGSSGSGAGSLLPVDVTGLSSGVAAISAGGHNTCAVTNAGALKCWGNNFSGQLGIGSAPPQPLDLMGPGATCPTTIQDQAPCISVPIDVPGLGSGMASADADQTACALTTGGGAKCWGYNAHGEVGNGTKVTNPNPNNPVFGYAQPSPVDVTGLGSGVSELVVGCARTSTGGVKCWGDNLYGGVGDGTMTERTTPVDVVGLSSGVSDIGEGGAFNCAVTTTGGVRCWGANGYRQLGAPTALCYAGTFLQQACSAVPVDVLFGFFVNSTGDQDDANTADGLCDIDLVTALEQCTLRAAIQQANATAGEDQIYFDVSPGGSQTITPASPLPDITGPVTIDATTQGGFAGSPIIELNGTSAGAGADGLRITGGNSKVTGLVINRFGDNGIELATNGGNTIRSNYIGTNTAGTSDLGNGHSGVFIDGVAGNVIGGTAAADRNVISGNDAHGMKISAASATGNQVRGNYIGTKVDGSTALANTQDGVFIDGAPDNVIGGTTGTTPGGACTGACNVISGNGGNGVTVTGASAHGDTVRENDIHGNSRVGIDLAADGVTWNDPGDGDSGANALLNAPDVTSVSAGTIGGHIDTVSPETVTVDVYASPSLEITGFAEGQVYLGAATPDVSGNWSLVLGSPPPYQYITATATSSFGSTSEFTNCVDPDGDGNPDDDGDALCDTWETLGIDYDGDGTIDLPLYDVNKDGTVQASEAASPNHKDIYIEIDWMAQHQPNAVALNDVVAAFAAAPVGNPDATIGIRLHLQQDEQAVAHNNSLSFQPCTAPPPGGTPDYDTVKTAMWGTAAERGGPNSVNILAAKRLVSRYDLYIHNLLGLGGTSGCAEGVTAAGNDFIVSLGSWTAVAGHGVGNRDEQAGTFMHELGHTLGLGHGGADSRNCKPNYLSVMSYIRQLRSPTGRPLDYSRFALLALNESALSEPAGIGAPPGEITLFGPPTVASPPVTSPALPVQIGGSWLVLSPVDLPIDWNKDGDSSDTGVSADINRMAAVGCPFESDTNGDGVGDTALLSTLVVQNDWTHLKFDFRNAGDFADGSHLSAPSSDEITRTEAVTLSPDTDGDGVVDLQDNCVSVSNSGQTNTDDALAASGAPVAPDELGDACDPDDDNDSGTAMQDPGPAAAACPAGSLPLWADCIEQFLSTDPLHTCALTTTANDENPDPWPVDFDDNRAVNILDILQLTPPVFNTSPPNPSYSQRKDLNADGAINILDILRLTPPVFNTSCTP